MNERVKDDAQQREGISLTPLAIPMLAGPGSISLLIGLYEEELERSWMVMEDGGKHYEKENS